VSSSTMQPSGTSIRNPVETKDFFPFQIRIWNAKKQTGTHPESQATFHGPSRNKENRLAKAF